MIRSTFGFTAGLCAAAIAGCIQAPASGPVGYIDIPLTAAGSDGATYRLPPDTRLQLRSDSFFDQVILDGDAPALTIDVPAGSYDVQLINPAGFTTTWPLIRESSDGTIQTVQATLDLVPTVTVTDNQTTPLAIRFHVALATTITFSHGSLHAFLEVDEASATTFAFDLAGPALTLDRLTVSATAPAELPARLPALGATGQHVDLAAQTTGPWHVAFSDTVCAPVLVASITGGGDLQLGDLIIEGTSADRTAQVCIQQAADAAFVSVTMARAGAAVTPLLSDLGDLVYNNVVGVGVSVPVQVFDRTSLHLAALTGQHQGRTTLLADIVDLGAPTGGSTFDVWVDLSATGDGTVTLTPQ